jgi:hypothetical protein
MYSLLKAKYENVHLFFTQLQSGIGQRSKTSAVDPCYEECGL